MLKAGVVAGFLAMAMQMVYGQESIALGLVRKDGFLIPLAAIGPTTELRSLRRSALDGAEWTLFGEAEPAVRFRSIARSTVESHCEPQTVWRTTLDRPAADPHIAPVQKIGIAARGASIEIATDVLAAPDGASQKVTQLIGPLANQQEREAIASDSGHPYRHLGEKVRATTPVKLEILRRHVINGIAVYYFEASKSYHPVDDVRVRGWMLDSPAGVSSRYVTYQLDDDGHKQNDRMTVWGVVNLGARSLWIMEGHGYEWEYYRIREWPSGQIRLHMDGGGC